jgi:hypothetical protein
MSRQTDSAGRPRIALSKPSGRLPLLLGRHLARRPHRPNGHLLSRASLIREPCFLSPRVLGPPLGPFEPLTGLQGIRFCSLEIHQLHLAATFQIITHGTPLPAFLRGELCHQAGERKGQQSRRFARWLKPHRLALSETLQSAMPRQEAPSCHLADSFIWRMSTLGISPQLLRHVRS